MLDSGSLDSRVTLSAASPGVAEGVMARGRGGGTAAAADAASDDVGRTTWYTT